MLHHDHCQLLIIIVYLEHKIKIIFIKKQVLVLLMIQSLNVTKKLIIDTDHVS